MRAQNLCKSNETQGKHPIGAYAHFCQKPHCTHKKCNGCPLYSKTTEDDARAVKEAGLSAKEAALLELQSNGGNFSNAEEVVNKIARELQ